MNKTLKGMAMRTYVGVFLGINGCCRTVFTSKLSLYTDGFDLYTHAPCRLDLRWHWSSFF